MKPTDRAREVLAELDRYARFPELRQARRDIIPAALDFADAVEATLERQTPTSPAEMPCSRLLEMREHLTAFLAQLDRATGGEA